MELGKKIKALRLRTGLTQEQLADRLGIAPQSVSKWENAVTMPDITLLPLLAEIFGVSMDEMFDLTHVQRMNRIENRMDIEEELPQDVFKEYEDFLKAQLKEGEDKDRACELLAYLYAHRMESVAKQVSRYAKEATVRNPGKKECQWLLQQAEGHTTWDWNCANHVKAIEFYREMIKIDPTAVLSYELLIDNLLADHRADEAEKVLEKLMTMEKFNPILGIVYKAHIALTRYDEKTADGIIEKMLADHPSDDAALFEAAQYYAKKGEYEKAIPLYEKAFEADKRKLWDPLLALADIYTILDDKQNVLKTYDRIIDVLRKDWGMTEEIYLKEILDKKAQLLAKM
ncbi:MAG: helix-turn-helix domain-containing protein [Clostridia bacterium]|nr:helix-turn-helix domain-containing protein [Clostridia bacterium]